LTSWYDLVGHTRPKLPFICENTWDLKDARLYQGWTDVIPCCLHVYDKPFKEFSSWMTNNVGTMVDPSDMTTSDTNGEWDYIDASIIIKDSKKAMLLKLTWGGLI
jgi:hypothetical protein